MSFTTTQAPGQTAASGRSVAVTVVLALLPLAALAGVLWLVSLVGVPGLTTAPVEDLAIERVVVTDDGFTVHVRNVGPEPVVVAHVLVNDMLVNFAAPEEIVRLKAATVTIPFDWVPLEPYAITLLTANAIKFEAEVPVALETPTATAGTLGALTLLGLYVGAVPVLVGLLWRPLLTRVKESTMNALLGVTVGLLLFLAVDATVEGLEIAEGLASALNPVAVLVAAAVGAYAALEAVAKARPAAGPLALAAAVALGVGLHNLGEGLAIGGAFSVGEVALGFALVVGFAIHNLTEGLAIVAPLGRGRVSLMALAGLGLLAGLPTIAGTWIGGLSGSPYLAVIFLGIGVGAIAQVSVAIDRGTGGAMRRGVGAAGVALGFLVMYVTSLLVSL